MIGFNVRSQTDTTQNIRINVSPGPIENVRILERFRLKANKRTLSRNVLVYNFSCLIEPAK